LLKIFLTEREAVIG